MRGGSKKEGICRSYSEAVLRGGSGEEGILVKKAIDVGKKHGINLKPGTKNKADGNCLYESVIDNIILRDCFTEELDRTKAKEYRRIWNKKGEVAVKQSPWYPSIYSAEQWKRAWFTLQNTNQYDLEYFGNMTILSCAHSLKKDILVINTPWKMTNASAHGPINVVSSNAFVATNERNTDVPIVLAYDGDHFESLIPITSDDVQTTVRLVNNFKAGNYMIPHSLEVLFKVNKELTSKQKNETEISKLKKTKNDQKEEINSADEFEVEDNPKTSTTKCEQNIWKIQPKKNTRKMKNTDEVASASGEIEVPLKKPKMTIAEKKAKATERVAKHRAAQSAEKKKEALAKDSAQKARSRDTQSAEKKEGAKDKNKAEQAKHRAKQHTKVQSKEAMKSQEILDGTYEVKDLMETEDTIGKMDKICKYCGAKKFQKETGSTCCGDGKVILELFPKPPNEIDKLWHANDAEGRLFRQHARSINNAVCLTSIKVKERKFKGGFIPCVVFEGKVQFFAGPLQADQGKQPCFAQLYVHDASLETGLRFNNMFIPANMSKPQKSILKKVLAKVQQDLHNNNPFIQDFKQIAEMSDDQIGQGKLVIIEKDKPVG